MSNSIIQDLITEGVLVLYHDYRSGSFVDRSGIGNDGTPTTTQWTNDGVTFFGANSKITVNNHASIQTSEMTLVIYADFITQTTSQYFMSKRSGGTAQFQWSMSSSSLSIWDGTDHRTLAYADLPGKKYCAINVKDGEIPESFVNGMSIGLHSASAALSSDSSDLIIGNYYLATTATSLQANTGAALYLSRKLTATEHSRLYAELESMSWSSQSTALSDIDLKVDINDSSLVAGYTMKPEKGLLIDQSGNGNNGTINGQPIFSNTLIGSFAQFNGSSDYITIGSTGQTVKSVSFLVKPVTTTEDFIDLDGGTHTIEATGGTITATGFDTPTIYVNGSVSSTLCANTWQLVVVTTATGFTASNLTLAKETLYLEGQLANLQFFSEEKDSTWVTKEYNKGKTALFKTEYGAYESVTTITSGNLNNTPFQISSGSFKISTDTIDGERIKAIACVSSGILYLPTSYFHQTATDSAYGEWVFHVNHSTASATRFQYICTEIGNFAASSQDGYFLEVGTGEQIYVYSIVNGSPTSRVSTTTGTVTAETWHKIKITRSTLGVTTIYLDDIPITAATGSNPFTLATNTESMYLNFDLDAGDKLAFSDKNGNYSIVKKLLS